MTTQDATPEALQRITKVTERTRHFFVAEFSPIERQMLNNEGGILSEQDIESAQQIFDQFRKPLEVLSDNNLELNNPVHKKIIRDAIATLYGFEILPGARRSGIGDTVETFLSNEENKAGFRTLYKMCGGDPRLFDDRSFAELELATPKKPDQPKTGLAPENLFTRRVAIVAGAAGVAGLGTTAYLLSKRKDFSFDIQDEAIAQRELRNGVGTSLSAEQMHEVNAFTSINLGEEAGKKLFHQKLSQLEKNTNLSNEHITKVIGKLYITALNTDNKPLALELAEHSEYFPKISYDYKDNSLGFTENKSKNYVQLANEGFTNDNRDIPDRLRIVAMSQPDWADELREKVELRQKQGTPKHSVPQLAEVQPQMGRRGFLDRLTGRGEPSSGNSRA